MRVYALNDTHGVVRFVQKHETPHTHTLCVRDSFAGIINFAEVSSSVFCSLSFDSCKMNLILAHTHTHRFGPTSDVVGSALAWMRLASLCVECKNKLISTNDSGELFRAACCQKDNRHWRTCTISNWPSHSDGAEQTYNNEFDKFAQRIRHPFVCVCVCAMCAMCAMWIRFVHGEKKKPESRNKVCGSICGPAPPSNAGLEPLIKMCDCACADDTTFAYKWV